MRVFFELLPRDTAEASRLAKKHDARLKGRAAIKSPAKHRLRHCVEIRHETFLAPAFFRLLRKHRIAFVFADSAGKWPYAEELTADFVYLRLHGAEKLYTSGYTGKALDRWAERVRAWANGRHPPDAQHVLPKAKQHKRIADVFVYFDNDVKVKAPFDAKRLMKRLGMEVC